MLYNRALVVFSGGQDSTTCLFYAKTVAREVLAVTFAYGQRHEVEIESARAIARMAKVKHEIVILPAGVLCGTSPLVNPSSEVEQYTNATVLPGGIEKTFVPMRNALFLVLAANRAVAWNCDTVITGISEEDYGGYPDCRALLLMTMHDMIDAAIGESARSPVLVAPLLHLDKAATVKMAQELPGCMEALAFSHTCYRGEFPPCGTCHACLLRARGFERAGVRDPLVLHAEDAAMGDDPFASAASTLGIPTPTKVR